MRIQKYNARPVLDLTGPDGNAYAILGAARRYSRQLDIEFDPIHTEMTSGDYDNLVDVFERYFGEYVDIITN